MRRKKEEQQHGLNVIQNVSHWKQFNSIKIDITTPLQL